MQDKRTVKCKQSALIWVKHGKFCCNGCSVPLLSSPLLSPLTSSEQLLLLDLEPNIAFILTIHYAKANIRILKSELFT